MPFKLKIDNKFLIKRRSRNYIQIILIANEMKYVNFLNPEQNWLLNPKKLRKSNTTIYFWNSVINKIVEMFKIKSQGKAI